MPKSFHVSLVIKGVIIAVCIALVLSLLLSLLLTFTPLQESTLAFNVIMGFSVFIAAVITAYRAGVKGLFYGISIGIGFTLLLLLMFGMLSPGSPTFLSIGEKSIIALTAGGIGGIIGVVVKG